jgi:hypothetical protein
MFISFFKERYMRELSILLLIGILAGCSSGILEYKPAHWKGLSWAIGGKANVGATTDAVTILVNDTVVITGNLSKLNPEGNFTGSYEGYDISAKCRLTGKGSSNHDCDVFVEGKMAGHLSF